MSGWSREQPRAARKSQVYVNAVYRVDDELSQIGAYAFESRLLPSRGGAPDGPVVFQLRQTTTVFPNKYTGFDPKFDVVSWTREGQILEVWHETALHHLERVGSLFHFQV